MLPDSLRDSVPVFQGSRFAVHRLEVTGGDGRRYGKDIVVHPGAVVVLPLLDDGRVVLIRNHRLAAGETLWELPAGTLEAGEPAVVCAGRELIEETGYRAGRIEALTMFYTSPGICTERMYAFLARDLEPVGQQLEATEQITVQPRTWAEVLDLLRGGDIRDGKTLAALLYYHALAS